MSGISRAGLLVTGGFAAVVLLELRTLLGMIGVDVDPLAHLVITIVVVSLLVIALDWFPKLSGRSGDRGGAAN